MVEFLDHYTPVEAPDGSNIFHSLDDARKVAGGDDNCIWFIRESESDEDFWLEDCGESPLPKDTPDYETAYDAWFDDMLYKHGPAPYQVSVWSGQYVNKIGFFVTVSPCRTEHRGEIFDY